MRITSLRLRNWLCHRNRQIDLAPLTVIRGPNGSGKSAIRDAIDYALTGEVQRVPLKSMRPMLLCEQFAKGELAAVELVADGLQYRRSISTGKLMVGCSLLPATATVLPYLLDPAAFMREKPEARHALMLGVLRISEDADALKCELVKAGHAPALVLELPTTAPDLWEDVADRMRSEARGAWQAVTGERYSAGLMATWTPKRPEHVPSDEDYRQITRAIAAHGVAMRELEAQLVDALAATRQADATKERIAELRQVDATKAEHPTLSKAFHSDEPRDYLAAECPLCLTFLRIEVPDQNAAVAFAELGRLEKRLLAYNVDDTELQSLHSRLQARRAAVHDLEDEARTMARAAREDQAADIQHTKATAWRTRLEACTALLHAVREIQLDTKGMVHALAAFNVTLAGHARAVGWPAPVVGADMSLTVDGRPYMLLSEAERWRTDAVLAVGLAEASGARLVLLDRWDVLDESSRRAPLDWLADLTASGTLETAILSGAVPPPRCPPPGRIAWVELP